MQKLRPSLLIAGLLCFTSAISAWNWPPGDQWIKIEIKGHSLEKILKKNSVTQLDVSFYPSKDSDLKITSLDFDARMPEHRHGMMTKAQTRKIEKNHFVIDGVNLHMSGYWELIFRLKSSVGPRILVIPYTLP